MYKPRRLFLFAYLKNNTCKFHFSWVFFSNLVSTCWYNFRRNKYYIVSIEKCFLRQASSPPVTHPLSPPSAFLNFYQSCCSFRCEFLTALGANQWRAHPTPQKRIEANSHPQLMTGTNQYAMSISNRWNYLLLLIKACITMLFYW